MPVSTTSARLSLSIWAASTPAARRLTFHRYNPNLPISAGNPQLIVPNKDKSTGLSILSQPPSTSRKSWVVASWTTSLPTAVTGEAIRTRPTSGPLPPVLRMAGTAANQAGPVLTGTLELPRKCPPDMTHSTAHGRSTITLATEIDLNITQNIVDKLNLDLVGAYMFTGRGLPRQDQSKSITQMTRTLMNLAPGCNGPSKFC